MLVIAESPHSQDALVSRIESLEQQNKKLLTFTVISLVVAAAVAGALAYTVIVGRSSNEKIVTQAGISLVDSKGAQRAYLGFNSKGEPGLDLFDEKGLSRATLAILGNDSVLWLRDEKGKGRMFAVGSDKPSIGILDKGGQVRAGLGYGQDDMINFYVADDKGKARAILGTTSLVNTKTGSEEKTAPSSLVLFDKQGSIVGKLPLF